MKFDIIVGNPPYQAPNIGLDRGDRPTLWTKFVKKSLLFLEKNGYLCFVHPNRWRNPDNKLWKTMTSKQIHYLEIHSLEDGQKMFNAGTRYDWYVLQNKFYETKTEVIDETGKQNFIDLREWNFFPNFNFNFFKNICDNKSDKNKIIYNNVYRVEKNNQSISEIKTNIFKYPLIHTINKDKIRYYYSSRNDKGHFGISKIIFDDKNYMNDVIIDMEGKYGMTCHAMAIPVRNLEEAQNIKKALLSKKFKKVLQTTSWGNYWISWKLFKYFKKDWWKEFIDEI